MVHEYPQPRMVQETPSTDERLSVTVPRDLYQWIGDYQARHDLTKAQVVRLALRQLREGDDITEREKGTP